MLARQLELFELYLRPCYKRTCWFESLGQGSLTKIYTKEDQRGSEAKKQKERKFKMDQAREEEERYYFQITLHNPDHYYTKNKSLILGVRAQKLSVLKGEEYRYKRNYTGEIHKI